MLVGDAGFFRDPLTSHGISDALRDAEGAAMAILSDRESALREFQEVRDSLALPILETTDAISAFDWSLEELPERHKRFSEAMKSEVAVLAARAARDRDASAFRRQASGPRRQRQSDTQTKEQDHANDDTIRMVRNPLRKTGSRGLVQSDGASRGPATSSPSPT